MIIKLNIKQWLGFFSLLVLLPLSQAEEGDVNSFLAEVEKSDYFSAAEKDFARQIAEGAKADDSVLDSIVNSPLISDRNKELARQYFHNKTQPEHIRYKDPKYDPSFKLVSPRLQFSGDLHYKLRSIETNNDVSNFFALDNPTYDEGYANLLQGQIRYVPQNRDENSVYGVFDFDIQTLDERTEIVNAHIQNRNNFWQVGSYLRPYFSELGLKNTEIAGVNGYFEKDKWMLNAVGGETVEDYVPTLDALSTAGLYLRRSLGKNGQDYMGLSAYEIGALRYYGFSDQTYIIPGLRFYSEIMHKNSSLKGDDGNAWQTEVDYENKKILFQNEYTSISRGFTSALNPEYSYLSGIPSEKSYLENAFTYRFDPFVTSSATLRNNSEKPAGTRPALDTSDFTWTLATQRPDRPKYLFVLKAAEKDDSRFSTDETQVFNLARTTFKARDIVTSIDLMRTDLNNHLNRGDSYIQNSFAVEVSRPFLRKLFIREKLTLNKQDYTDTTLNNESQNNVLEARYKFNDRNSIRGLQNYRRTAFQAKPNKYKTVYTVEANRKVDENTKYNLRLDSYNYNEFTKGYDARQITAGVDFIF